MSTSRLWYYRGMNEEVFSFEDRDYVNPTLSRDEQLSFIDNFRDIEQQNINQINADTYALGTQVPSNLGGLTGSEGIWNARYRTPKTETTIANLQAAAQQSALNQAMTNLQNMWQNRYNQAYRNARAKAYNDAKAAQQAALNAALNYKSTDTTASGTVSTSAPGTSVVETPNGLGLGIYDSSQAFSGNGATPIATQYSQNQYGGTETVNEDYMKWQNNLKNAVNSQWVNLIPGIGPLLGGITGIGNLIGWGK